MVPKEVHCTIGETKQIVSTTKIPMAIKLYPKKEKKKREPLTLERTRRHTWTANTSLRDSSYTTLSEASSWWLAAITEKRSSRVHQQIESAKKPDLAKKESMKIREYTYRHEKEVPEGNNSRLYQNPCQIFLKVDTSDSKCRLLNLLTERVPMEFIITLIISKG